MTMARGEGGRGKEKWVAGVVAAVLGVKFFP
jgi:hypothetical protein